MLKARKGETLHFFFRVRLSTNINIQQYIAWDRRFEVIFQVNAIDPRFLIIFLSAARSTAPALLSIPLQMGQAESIDYAG